MKRKLGCYFPSPIHTADLIALPQHLLIYPSSAYSRHHSHHVHLAPTIQTPQKLGQNRKTATTQGSSHLSLLSISFPAFQSKQEDSRQEPTITTWSPSASSRMGASKTMEPLSPPRLLHLPQLARLCALPAVEVALFYPYYPCYFGVVGFSSWLLIGSEGSGDEVERFSSDWICNTGRSIMAASGTEVGF